MRNLIYFFGTVLFLPIVSCEKFLDIDPPVQEIVSEKVFSNIENATSAVVGLYSRMTSRNNDGMNGFLSIYTGLASDEIWNTSVNSSFDPFKNNAILDNNSVIVSNVWNPMYNYIFQTNKIIEQLSESKMLAIDERQRLLGEMYFTRALLHFYLLNLFGDIPLILTSDYQLNRFATRNSTDEIYKQIILDLSTSIDLLPETYPNLERIRPNKFAAKAFLARVYLYTKQYDKAILEASDVINTNSYKLEANLSNVFLPTSKEAIWQLFSTNTAYNTAEGFAFIPNNATTRPAFSFYQRVIDGFGSGDKRKSEWTSTRIISNVTYIYPTKYKIRSNATKTEYNTVFRLAEQYLIRAEAYLYSDEVKNGIKDINTLRSRAGTNLMDENLSKDQAIQMLIQENQNEFFAEWGHRWLDLKRWGIINEEMLKTKPGWLSTSAYFLIPATEFIQNPNL
ncbi:MAG: RagB/SusD family nutrient uptake outer membrane protein [Taibaiella sp.]|nr:RagB/SusD family nutrient uptake outer membrane protein [Taibaiella sp.]